MSPTATRPPAADRPPASRIDPRIRERRTAVTRAAGRRRRRILLAVVAVVVLVVAGWVFLHTKALAARSVTVVGSVHTPEATVVATAGLAGQPPMIDVDTGAAAARLERLPWVATATVSRQWPDGVRIAITERTPVAAVSTTSITSTTSTTTQAPAGQGGGGPSTTVAPAGAGTTTTTAPTTTTTTTTAGSSSTTTGSSSTTAGSSSTATSTTAPTAPGWALVDRTGRVLADVATPPAGLVHLVGPAPPGAPGTVLRSAQPGLQVAATLPKAFAGQVAEVDVDAAGQVNLKLTSPLTVDLGTTAQLRQKYEDVAAILAGAHLAEGDVIHVNVPESPTVAAG
ncbi:MAG TPA: FtsQ-type POTRA domain-containing protein [Acidimicrobiales bacterium]|nr:FtsQ-type POTRA domain-containing protein [Acidimicrobiales bacterium]